MWNKHNFMKNITKIDLWEILAGVGLILTLFTGITNVMIAKELNIQSQHIREVLKVVKTQQTSLSIHGSQNNALLIEMSLLKSDVDLLKMKINEK